MKIKLIHAWYLEPASHLEATLLGTTSQTKDSQPVKPVSPPGSWLCVSRETGQATLEPGSLTSAKASILQLHRQHTNFIHIDTKVDFSRNVPLCEREKVEQGQGGRPMVAGLGELGPSHSALSIRGRLVGVGRYTSGEGDRDSGRMGLGHTCCWCPFPLACSLLPRDALAWIKQGGPTPSLPTPSLGWEGLPCPRWQMGRG